MKIAQYTGLFAVLLIVQIVVLPFFSVFDIAPDAVLIGLIYLAIHQGGVAAMLAALAVGFIRDAFTSHFIGAYMLSYVVASFLSGVLFKFRERLSFQIQSMYLFIVLFSFQLIYYSLFMLDQKLNLAQLIFRLSLPGAIYTLVLVAITHFLLPRGFWR